MRPRHHRRRSSDAVGKGRRRWALSVRIISWVTALAFVGAYVTILALPVVFQMRGERLLVVTSGSMAPTFRAGDAVVLHAVEHESDLKEGQVITFWPAHGSAMVTHRIVGLRLLPVLEQDETTGRMVPAYDAGGDPLERPYVQTKGDANDVPDANLTPVSRVRGIVLGVKPGWGAVLSWAGTGEGRAALLLPPLLIMMISEAVVVLRQRRRPSAPSQIELEREQVRDVLAV